MRNKKGMLLSVLCIGMEMFWLYAWAAFCMSAARAFFPLSGALIAFLLGTAITHFSIGKGWRIISVIAVQGFAFGAAISIIIYLSYFLSYPLFSKLWLVQFFTATRSPFEWLNLILVIFWSVLFWISGSVFSKRINSYYKLCSRFDLGVTAFFCLFIIKLVMLIKGGIKVDDISFTLIFPFFLFSLLAIGIVKTQNASKNFIPGFRGIGIIAGISIVVILSAVSILVLMPVLTQTAEISYRILKSGAGFFMPVVISILRFLFAPRSMRSEPAQSSPKPDHGNWIPENSRWIELIEDILRWGFKIIALILIVFFSGFILYYLFKWLFSKTSVLHRDVEKSDGAPWFIRLWVILVLICKTIIRSFRGHHKAVEFYRTLLQWGRRSGISSSIDDTPLEYGARLKYYFPCLKSEIDLIVSAFNSEVYGGIDLSRGSITNVRSAWRRLCSPRNWPARLRLLFTDRGNVERYKAALTSP
jgi:hypothetical protein